MKNNHICPDNSNITKGMILLVDDNPKNLLVLEEILTENGYNVHSASDGSLALKSMQALLPDLILLDIKMPDMDGYEVCRQLKADERTRKVPVIFISALDDLPNKVNAFQVGGVDYIPKPFHIQEVLARVKTHLALRNMQKKLEKQNIWLQQEIADRKKAEAALQKAHNELELRVEQRTAELAKANKDLEGAKAAAEAASRAKTEFLQNISHELRTPLNPIIGMTDLVLQTTELTPNQRKCLNSARKAANKLLVMIEELIELSRIEADGLEPVDKPFTVTAVLKTTFDALTSKAECKNLKLTSRIDSDVPDFITGDPDLLLKILLKLGGNAIKFTEEGEISVSVTKESEEGASIVLRFSISDTGIGIPAEHLENIFRDFTQADGSSTRKHDGIGLGLTMARRLIEYLSGQIWVESEPGQGSTFHFTGKFGQE
jgi:signal transduction histidine kinase